MDKEDSRLEILAIQLPAERLSGLSEKSEKISKGTGRYNKKSSLLQTFSYTVNSECAHQMCHAVPALRLCHMIYET